MKCNRGTCPGTIEGGYCDTCGLAPVAAAATAGTRHPTGVSRPSTSRGTRGSSSALSTRSASSHRSGSSRTGSRRRFGAGLVDVAPVPQPDPATVVMPVAAVAENKRFCARCDKPVGRSVAGNPGRVTGFCPHCGERFDFTPKLKTGDLVAGQYSVVGPLAYGGLGWIYLARDKNVSDRWVVLKGLLNASDPSAAAAAVAERRFLAEVEHPNIVKIYNFVEHGGAGYIVMEYVGGPSLKTILKDRREANGNKPAPLPVTQALAFLLEVMPAFTYLHDRGLLFCDFKPDNVIQNGDLVKLIDLGGVVREDDDTADVFGTVGFQAPEIAELGPSVASDLYTIGRTLAVLTVDFVGYQTTYASSLPDPTTVDVFTRYDSFYRLVAKATDPDPQARFTSAVEMADQMLGVLREVLAVDGEPKPAPSTVFTGELRHHAGGDGDRDLWRNLPVPLVDLTDPAAAFLASITVTEPADVLALLATAPQQSPEVKLRTLRTLIEQATATDASTEPRTRADQFAAARQAVSDAIADLGNDWRVAWFDGMLVLAEGDHDRAYTQFDAVYACLPGELAPKLALGLTWELRGDCQAAIGFYDTISRTDPAYTAAHAGLARCRLAVGDRTGAVEAYGRVPTTSAAHRTAQVAAVQALTRTVAGGRPHPGSLPTAAVMISALEVTPAERAALRAELLEVALETVAARQPVPASVLGPTHNPTTPVDERDLRFALEGCYRQMAEVRTGRQRFELVDRANAVRPRTRT